MILFAVNDSLQDITRPLDLSAFGAAGQTVSVLSLTDREHAGEPDVTNSFAEPDRVTPVIWSLVGGGPRFDFKFRALTLTVLEWHVGK